MKTEITIKVTFQRGDDLSPELNDAEYLETVIYNRIRGWADTHYKDRWGHNLSSDVEIETVGISNDYSN